jgi:hypothetical protein
VEIGQRKVHAVPTVTAREAERLRQAAGLAASLTQEAAIEAAKVNVPPTVSKPLGEAAALSGAVSTALGPPSKPAASPSVSEDVVRDKARLNARLEKFRARNDRDEGKAIEGTGFLKVPYFAWVGGFLLIVLIGFVALRTFLAIAANSNPIVGGVLGGVRVAGALAGKGLTAVVHAGEQFKAAVKKADRALSPDEVIAMFRAEQNNAQDLDVKQVVGQVTKK